MVMEGVWGVLCHNCGALSHHAQTEKEARKLWNKNSLQRSIGYFTDGRYEKEAIECGKWAKLNITLKDGRVIEEDGSFYGEVDMKWASTENFYDENYKEVAQ